jgi:amino acid transporter
MNRWARIQFGIATLGTLGFAAVGVQGLTDGTNRQLLTLHTQAALATTLALVFAHGWIAIFVLAFRRRARDLSGAAGELAAADRGLLAAAAAALAAVVTHFVLAGLMFATRAPAVLHGGIAAATLAVLIVALAVEARLLARHQRGVEALAALPEPSARVLDSAGS